MQDGGCQGLRQEEMGKWGYCLMGRVSALEGEKNSGNE